MASFDFLQSFPANTMILVIGALILFLILLVLVVAVSFFLGRRKYMSSSYPVRDPRIVLNKDDFPDMEIDEPAETADAASETSEAAARPSRAPSVPPVRSVEEDDVVYMAPVKKEEPVRESDASASSGSVESASEASESASENRFVREPAVAAAAAEPAAADDGVEIYEDNTLSGKRDDEPNPFIIDFPRADHAPAQVSESPEPIVADPETGDTRITFEEIRLSPATAAVNEHVAVSAAVNEHVAVSAAVDEHVAVSAVPEDVPIIAPAEIGSDDSGDDADGGVEIWDDIKPEDDAPAAKRTHKYAYFDAVLQEEKEREALKRASAAAEPAAEETSVSEEMPAADDLSAADDAPSDDSSYGAASEDSTAQTTVSEKKDDDTADLPDPDY